MRDLSIGQAWDEAKAALAANRRLITPVVLGLVLLPTALAGMIAPPPQPGSEPSTAWLVATLLLLLAMVLAQMTVVLIVNGWRGRVGEAIGRAGRRVPVLLVAGLLVAIPIIVLLVVLALLIAMGTGGAESFSAESMSPAGAMLFLGAMLLFLVVTVRLMPLIVVAAQTDIGPIASVKRALALTSGNFWRLLGFFVAVFVGFLVLAMAVDVVVGALAALLFGKAVAWSLSALLVALASGLVQAGFVAIYSAMLARITAQLMADPAP